MTQTLPSTQPERLTYEEYLDYQGHGDTRYELSHVCLIPMPAATILHSRICQFLVYQFPQLMATFHLALICITNVAVRTEVDTVRVPDVLICP